MKYIECQWPETVACPRCGHEQGIVSHETEQCGSCGSRLVIYCRHCHRPNLRSDDRCGHCRSQLHPSMRAHRTGMKARHIPGWMMALSVIAAILVGTGAVVAAFEFYMNLPKSKDPDVQPPPEAQVVYPQSVPR